MKSFLIAAIGLLYFAFTAKEKLTGTWQRINETGPAYQVIFREDSTYDVLVNEKQGVTGKYQLKNDLLTIDDTGCPQMTGTYKVSFNSTGDSCRMEVINDDCGGRRQTADGATLVRVKKFKL